MSWVPMPAKSWPVVAELLPLPWCDEAAQFDLRWHHDQEDEVPSRYVLAKRWGWTPDEVRTLLRNADRWWDPMKGPAPEERRKGPRPKKAVTQLDPPTPTADPPTPTDERSDAELEDAVTQVDPPTPKPDPSTPHARIARGSFSPSPSPSPPPSHTQGTTAPAPVPNGLPAWAKGQKVDPHALMGAVVRSIEAIRQRPVLPDRCATDAKAFLALWRALQRPPVEELAAEVELVARWARESSDPAAARNLRAEGWAEGVDRSRSVATLLRHDRWQDRLDAARRPAAEAIPPPARASPARGQSTSGDGLIERLYRKQHVTAEVIDAEPVRSAVLLDAAGDDGPSQALGDRARGGAGAVGVGSRAR